MASDRLHLAELNVGRLIAPADDHCARDRRRADLRVWLLLAPLVVHAGCVSEDRSQSGPKAAAQIGSTVGAAVDGPYSGAIAEVNDPHATEIDPHSWPRGNAPASFTDITEIAVSLRTGVVRGTAWAFEDSGNVTNHHGVDVGLVLDNKTYFVRIDHKLGRNFVPADVKKVIPIVRKFCEAHSLVPRSEFLGADVVAEGQTLKLVEFCVPKGVVLPPTWQSGDRIPRGPNE